MTTYTPSPEVIAEASAKAQVLLDAMRFNLASGSYSDMLYHFERQFMDELQTWLSDCIRSEAKKMVLAGSHQLVCKLLNLQDEFGK